jgi:hypothetical protein
MDSTNDSEQQQMRQLAARTEEGALRTQRILRDATLVATAQSPAQPASPAGLAMGGLPTVTESAAARPAQTSNGPAPAAGPSNQPGARRGR